MSDTPGSRIVWVVIAGGLVFVAMAVVFAGRFGTDPGISSSPLIGQPAPNSEIGLMDGSGTVALDDFEGDIRVVNYWEIGRASCRERV